MSHLGTREKQDKMQAPPGYVAGLGRGASGFTTRSDIGPAREVGSMVEPATAGGPVDSGYGSAQGVRAASSRLSLTDQGMRIEDEEAQREATGQYQDPENETGLFAGVPYEADDAEADKIYESVDAEMDKRRKKVKDAREAREEEEFRAKNPRISERFSDLKRSLASVTDQQWEALPEVGNLTGKRRKHNLRELREQRAFVVPDSVVVGGRDRNAVESSLDAKQMAAGTPIDGTMTDFREIGSAQKQVLSLKLDAQASKDSGAGSSTIDPKGYLTDLDSVVIKSEAEIGDTKRGRTLLQSLTKTNPKHAPGWIAAARLEEVAGKMVAARRIIAEGCQNCPTSDEVWRESARLNTPENARVVLADAVRHIPQSVNIWLDATDLEQDVNSKKRVLRKALEYIPNSVKLWKRMVSLEDDSENAKVLLQRATEVVPESIDLWLALARVETPENAKAVLNQARAAIPTSHELLIAGARLLEQDIQQGAADNGQVGKLMERAVRALRAKGVELSRDEWFKEAERCEQNGSLITCRAIVDATIAQGVDDDQRLDTWLDDAEASLARDRTQTARAVYAYALRAYPHKQSLWRSAAELERAHGTRDDYLSLLEQAFTALPHAEEFWLRAAKSLWKEAGDVESARAVLQRAFELNPNSESIWLAAVRIEAESDEVDRARQLMRKALAAAKSERVYVKAAVLERQYGTPAAGLELAREGLARFPTAAKLHMLVGQCLASMGDAAGAREAYATGLKRCPDSVPLYVLASRLEESVGLAIKSRSILERARHLKSDVIFDEAIAVENRAGNPAQAKALLARGLQQCPKSGRLWTAAIWAEPRPQRRSKSADALRATDNDVRVLVTVARLFYAERAVDKARNWFQRAVGVAGNRGDADFGDAWAWWLKFEQQHGTVAQRDDVIKRCELAEPKHGDIWPTIAKDPANARKSTTDVLRLVAKSLASS